MMQRLEELCAISEDDAIVYLFDWFENDYLIPGKFQELDDVLRQADMEKLLDVIIIGLVRVPYLAREFLPSWKAAVERARAVLKNRGRDAGRLLIGLQ